MFVADCSNAQLEMTSNVVDQSVCHSWCVQPLVLGKYVDPVCYVGSQNDWLDACYVNLLVYVNLCLSYIICWTWMLWNITWIINFSVWLFCEPFDWTCMFSIMLYIICCTWMLWNSMWIIIFSVINYSIWVKCYITVRARGREGVDEGEREG